MWCVWVPVLVNLNINKAGSGCGDLIICPFGCSWRCHVFLRPGPGQLQAPGHRNWSDAGIAMYPSIEISVIPPQNYCLTGKVVHIWHRYTAYTIISEVDEQRSLKQSVNVVLCGEQDHNIICLNNNIVLIDVHQYHNWRTLMFDWCSAGCLDMGRLWDGAAWCHFVSIRSSIHDNQW